jgi:hypothetical protein
MPLDNPYPVLEGEDTVYPQCVVCKRSCGEPGEFLMLTAGAILHTDATRQNGGPDDLMSGFFTLVKHGAEPDGPYVTLDIVRDLVGGQADLLFCSGTCMREFFNSAVDELERLWREA